MTEYNAAAVRADIAREHADQVRDAFSLLKRIDPDTDVPTVIRQLLHLAQVDGHTGSDRPELLLAGAWLQYALSGDVPSSGDGLPVLAHTAESRAARPSLRSPDWRRPADDQLREHNTQQVLAMLRAAVAEKLADPADLMADVLHGFASEFRP